MKRGKGEEKVMGPMFPRLHVNDTEKGGPRAPPRNKMALYEQLSIPSQRFNPAVLPFNPNNTANLVPPPASQGSEQGLFYSLQLPPSRHVTEKPHTHYSDLNTPAAKPDPKKKGDEDDFTVPVFINSKVGNRGISTRQERRTGNEENLNEFAGRREQSVRAAANCASRNKFQGPIKQNNASVCAERREEPTNDFRRSHRTDHFVQPEHGCNSRATGANQDDAVLDERTMVMDDGDSSVPVRGFPSEERGIANDLINDVESCEDRTCGSLQLENVDGDDDVSETSMVDSVSGLDISPDDVVGIIGQKHFWKARLAFVNQQRVFAVQVFELHRLIKVQRSIAESPNLLLEESAFLGKALKGGSVKKLPLEYNVPKHKNHSEKQNHKMECSAENTVAKASLSSVQNGSQSSMHRAFTGKFAPNVAAATNDPNMGPWCFHQPSGHQWLIPVMSPSEGLVYKPYPGPGFAGPICGGCGPPGSAPAISNFIPPPFGVAASSNHYPAVGVPFASSVGHGYFPPYGMPVMNPTFSPSAVEQMNHFASPGSQGQVTGAGPNYKVQHQSSCSVPSQKNGAVSDLRFHVSNDTEIQASTASSPSERGQRVGVSGDAKGRSVLPLFPTSPAINVPDGNPHPQEAVHPARVIRVVPHNARSATESAARIFQSIQEERKQYDSGLGHL